MLYALLSEAEQARLRDDLRVFIAEKQWEGCGGLDITDEIKVTIAAQAMLAGPGSGAQLLSIASCRSWSIPTATGLPRTRAFGDNAVTAEHERPARRGPLSRPGHPVLARGDATKAATRAPAATWCYHEFAHQLDMLDGVVNGTPPLHDREQYRRWQKVMTQEYEKLIAQARSRSGDAARQVRHHERGRVLRGGDGMLFRQAGREWPRHPQLYELLREYLPQDPAARERRHGQDR